VNFRDNRVFISGTFLEKKSEKWIRGDENSNFAGKKTSKIDKSGAKMGARKWRIE
jgi:hypothetical protein